MINLEPETEVICFARAKWNSSSERGIYIKIVLEKDVLRSAEYHNWDITICWQVIEEDAYRYHKSWEER